MTLEATGMLDIYARIQYLCMLVHGKTLRQFDLFSTEIENTETINVDYYIKGLAFYPPPCEFAFFLNARNAPRNEKTAQSKSSKLCGALDQYE